MTSKEHLRKYGCPNTAFDGLSWVAYMSGINGNSYSSAEDPHAGEALDALLEQVERKVWALCIIVGERKARKRK